MPSPKGALEEARRYEEAVERGWVKKAGAKRLRMQTSAAELQKRVDQLKWKAENEAMKVPPTSLIM